MHTLRLLGTLRLEDDDGPVTGRAAQARRRAVLALLAAAPDRTLSRDKLVGLVWPETTESKARHGLSTALYDLRRELGDEALVSHGDHEIELSPAHVATDLDAFLDARDRGDAEAALEAYAGDFLDGFYLKDAPDFERWADEERRTLRRDLAGLLESAAAAAAAEGRVEDAASLWRERAGLDPYDARVAARAVEALAAAGDATGAVRVARRYEAAVREELEVEPDPGVMQRAVAVRGRVAAPPLAAPGPMRGEGDADGGAASDAAGGGPVVWRARRLSRWGMALLGAVVIASVSWAGGLRRPPPPAGPPGVRVAVLPFSVRNEDARWLSRAAAELLAVRLQVPDAITATDPFTVLTLADASPGWPGTPAAADAVARRVGATHFVLGSVRGDSVGLHLTAGLYASGGDHVGAVTAAAPGEAALAAAMDSLALRLLAGPLDKGRPVAWSEGQMTASLPALRAYVAGLEAFRAGDYNTSVRYLQQAVAEDSLFALAHLRLGIAAEWAGRLDLTASALERADALRSRLTERDQLLLDGKRAATTGDGRTAVEAFRAIVARDPGDVEALYEVGDVYFHNPDWGVSAEEAATWFRRALAIDSTHMAAIQHLTRLLAAAGKVEELERWAALALEQGVDGLAATELRTLTALMTGDSAGLAEAEAELRLLSGNRLLAVVLNTLRHSLRPVDAEPLVRLLTEPERRRDVRATGEILRGFAAAADGRPGDARRHLAAARDLDARRGTLAAALLAGAGFTDASGDPDTLIRELRALPSPEPGPLDVRAPNFNTESHRLLLLGRLYLRSGRPDSARALVSRLAQGTGSTAAGDARLLEAEIAYAAGDVETALERVGADAGVLPAVSDPAGWVPYFRGRLLEERGRFEEAARWYGAMRHEADFGVLFDNAMKERAEALRRSARPGDAGAPRRGR